MAVIDPAMIGVVDVRVFAPLVEKEILKSPWEVARRMPCPVDCETSGPPPQADRRNRQATER